MKKKSLFTFVVEFRKGTYISQVRSKNVIESFQRWAANIDPKMIKHLDSKTLGFIKEHVQSKELDKPTKIDGMRNTWFAVLVTKKGALYINIIKTV